MKSTPPNPSVPTLKLTKTQKRNLRKRRRGRGACPHTCPSPSPAPLSRHSCLPNEPVQRGSPADGQLLPLSEKVVGALLSAVVSELPSQGVVVPSLPINNHPAHWSEGLSDTVYILLTNIKVCSLARWDDRARHEDLPPGVRDFACGPYKLPILRPCPLELPMVRGVVVYPTTEQHAARQYAATLEDLPPKHRVRVTSSTVVHVESELAAKSALLGFATAAIASFGDESRLSGMWSAYVGKHNDCGADSGHADAFSRVFQVNGPAAEMARTRSSVGYGPSVGRSLQKLDLEDCRALVSLPDSKWLLIPPAPLLCYCIPYSEIGLTVSPSAARRASGNWPTSRTSTCGSARSWHRCQKVSAILIPNLTACFISFPK